jgi:hypothetical protein
MGAPPLLLLARQSSGEKSVVWGPLILRYRRSDLDDGKIGTDRLEEVADVSPVASYHRSGADNGGGHDRPVNDVGGASLGENPANTVGGVLVQFGNIAPTEQPTKLDLAGRSAGLGDDGSWGDRNRSLFQPYPVISPERPVVALGRDQRSSVVNDPTHAD